MCKIQCARSLLGEVVQRGKQQKQPPVTASRPCDLTGLGDMATQFTTRALESATTKDKFVYLTPTSPLRDASDVDSSPEILALTAAEADISS